MEPADQARIAFLLSEANREMEAYHTRLRLFEAQRWILGPILTLIVAPILLMVALTTLFVISYLLLPLGLVAFFGFIFVSVNTVSRITTHAKNKKQELKIITPYHNDLLWKLANSRDRQAIGLFIDTLDLQDGEAREIAENALTKLLSRLPQQEADRITSRQRQKLYQSLMTFTEGTETFCLAIIQVIAYIGDKDAIPVLENVAIRKAPSRVRQRVIQAAQEMLPVLKERLQREKTGETLLRASAPPVLPAETLLRPAASLPATEPQQLLRASTQKPENL